MRALSGRDTCPHAVECPIRSAKLGYKAKNPIDPASLSAAQLEEVEAFLAAIDDNDDVQNVFVGLQG